MKNLYTASLATIIYMKSPYKIKHWSPVKKIPKSVDGWYNVLEWEDVEADEYGAEY